MSNDVKRELSNVNVRDMGRIDASGPSARLMLLACLVALGALLTQLPGPVQAWATLTGGARHRTAADPLAAVQSVLLTAAGLLTWLIAGWAVVVLGVGLLSRLPGGPGRRARRLLPRIAPAAVGRLVLAAVGLSLIAGTAACAVPTPVPPAGATSPSARPASEPSSEAVSEAVSGPESDAAGGSFTIDWPDPTPAPASTPDPDSSTPADDPATAPPHPSTTGPAIDPTAVPTTEPASVPAPGTATAASTSASSAATAPDADRSPAPGTPSESPAPAAGPPMAPGAAEPPGPADPPAVRGAGPACDPAPAVAPLQPVRIVTVQPGDSLWRIAARSLGPDATDADVDNAWRAWYFGNREIIGDDPDRILPGQSLLTPGSEGVQR